MIRPAKINDAPQVARLIMLAMGPLAGKFANSSSDTEIHELFTHFVTQPANQYSYNNILVWEEDDALAGMIMAYDGGQLDQLRAPFLKYIRSERGFAGDIEDETAAGEYYIDCLAVSPDYQGKGIAKELIAAMVDHAQELGHNTVGLLVSKDNDGAKKLYTSLGFEQVGEQALLGGYHYHMQYHNHI